MREKEISTIQEYINLVDEIKNENGANDLIFRGQPVDKPLLPKIARLTLRKRKIKDIEQPIFEEFKRGVIPYTEFRPDNDWDWLALAQHHGLPTRLLDWTYSALTALWFAVKDISAPESNGIVYILAGDTDDFQFDTGASSPFFVQSTKIFRSSVVTKRISAQSGLFTVHLIKDDSSLVRFEKIKSTQIN
jgi:hypothetical protein